jgi:hypothetical protein
MPVKPQHRIHASRSAARTGLGFFGIGPSVLRRAAHQALFAASFKPRQFIAPSYKRHRLARANPEFRSGRRGRIIWPEPANAVITERSNSSAP